MILMLDSDVRAIRFYAYLKAMEYLEELKEPEYVWNFRDDCLESPINEGAPFALFELEKWFYQWMDKYKPLKGVRLNRRS